MIKRVAAVVCSLVLMGSLCACGSTATKKEEGKAPNTDVESIDFSTDAGSIKYVKAGKALASSSDLNAWVFFFDFTNQQDEPTSVTSVFNISFFQNGVQVTRNANIILNSSEETKLRQNRDSKVMKGNTVNFGEGIVLENNSPVTITVKPVSPKNKDDYQTMVVDIAAIEKATAEVQQTVANNLQGSWEAADGLSTITFTDGSFSLDSDDSIYIFEGPYSIVPESSNVKCSISTSDGNMVITYTYKMDDGGFQLFKSDGSPMTKI